MWVRLPPLVQCNDLETNGGTDAKYEMETWGNPDTNRTAVTLFLRGISLDGRALDLHSRGRGFDSLILHIGRSGGKMFYYGSEH